MMIGGGYKSKDEKPSFGKSDDEEESGGGMLTGMAGKRAAKAVMKALESGDVGALHEALKSHYQACHGDDE